MTLTQAEDRLLFFLCTSLELKTLLLELKNKYACAIRYNLDKEIVEIINEQILMLETSKYACTTAANFILKFDAETLN